MTLQPEAKAAFTWLLHRLGEHGPHVCYTLNGELGTSARELNCWSEARQAYVFYPGSEKLDASIALAVRFGFPRPERLKRTLHAIDQELGCGAFHYRYSEVDKEEGCFLACTFWIAEAQALLGDHKKATETFEQAIEHLGAGVGIYSEMLDPRTGEYLGNLPQALTHLALIGTASTLSGCGPER